MTTHLSGRRVPADPARAAREREALRERVARAHPDGIDVTPADLRRRLARRMVASRTRRTA